MLFALLHASSLLNVQWGFPEATWSLPCTRFTTEADVRIWVPLIRFVIKEIRKNLTSCHACSLGFVWVTSGKHYYFNEYVIYINMIYYFK